MSQDRAILLCRLKRIRSSRDNNKVQQLLKQLEQAAKDGTVMCRFARVATII